MKRHWGGGKADSTGESNRTGTQSHFLEGSSIRLLKKPSVFLQAVVLTCFIPDGASCQVQGPTFGPRVDFSPGFVASSIGFVRFPETDERGLVLSSASRNEVNLYLLNKSGSLSIIGSRTTSARVRSLIRHSTPNHEWFALFCPERGRVEVVPSFRGDSTTVISIPREADNMLFEDVTNDARPDLLIFGKRTAGITVYHGTATGFSSTGVSILPEISVSDVVTTDLNGDMIKDIFVSDWLSNRVILYLGIGRGIFSEQVSVALTGEPADLAFSEESPRRSRIAVTIPDRKQVLLFDVNALGEFKLEVTLQCPGIPRKLQFTDVNTDGLADLVTGTEGELVVFAGRTDRHFLEPSLFSAGGTISAWMIADLDGDRRDDAVISTSNPARVVLLGNSSFSGAIDWPATYGVGRSPRGLTTGDFNGDGMPDIGVVSSTPGSLCILLNQGNGRMAGPTFSQVAENPVSVKAVAGGSGISSTFVISHYPSTQITVVRGNGPSRLASFAIPTALNPFVLSAEIDQSHQKLSFLTMNRGDNKRNLSLSLFDEISEDQFIETSLQPNPPRRVTSITSFDMTGDGEGDLVFSTFEQKRGESTISVSRGIDRFSFSPHEQMFSFRDTLGAVRFIRAAFIDNDSRADIIVVLGKPFTSVLLLYGSHNAAVRDSAQWIYDVDIPGEDALIVEDLNNDGNKDMCFVDLRAQAVVAVYGTGNGSFANRKSVCPAEGVRALMVGSFRSPPVKDLFISNEIDGTVSLMNNPF